MKGRSLLLGLLVGFFVGIGISQGRKIFPLRSGVQLSGEVVCDINDLSHGLAYSSNQQSGFVIILNGVSSAGKSSVSTALAYLSQEPMLQAGVDAFIAMVPLKYRNGIKGDEGFAFVPDISSSEPTIRFKPGPFGRSVKSVVPKMIRMLAQQGFNVVADTLITDEIELAHYREVLKGICTYFIGVHCDLKVCEEREVLRGDRLPGVARGNFELVHRFIENYDLEVDTSQKSPFEAARSILAFIEKSSGYRGQDAWK